MSNRDYWAGQQSVNSLRIWDDRQSRRTARNAAEWQAYAYELEARILAIRADRDDAIEEWKRYSQGLADKLRTVEVELQKALGLEADFQDQLDANATGIRKP